MIFVTSAAKAFGVTDFINPNEIEESVQQVIFDSFVKLFMLIPVVMLIFLFVPLSGYQANH